MRYIFSDAFPPLALSLTAWIRAVRTDQDTAGMLSYLRTSSTKQTNPLLFNSASPKISEYRRKIARCFTRMSHECLQSLVPERILISLRNISIQASRVCMSLYSDLPSLTRMAQCLWLLTTVSSQCYKLCHRLLHMSWKVLRTTRSCLSQQQSILYVTYVYCCCERYMTKANEGGFYFSPV